MSSQGPYLNSERDEGAGRAPNTVPSIQRRVTVSYLAVKQRETSHSYNQGLSWWSQIGQLDIPGDSGEYIQFRYLGKWQLSLAMRLSLTWLTELSFILHFVYPAAPPHLW